MMKSLLLLIPMIFLLGSTALAHGELEPCKIIEYGNKSQIDPKPLSVRVVSGRVMYQTGKLTEKVQDVDPIPAACIGLFIEKDHHLVATAVADNEGHFKFSEIPSGHYRLVVRDPDNGLCVANVPLRVDRKGKKSDKGKQIVVHMRVAGIDDCSYGGYK